MGELPEVHLPSKESDDLKSLAKYRKSLGEEITMVKNRIHALLTGCVITIDAKDIFGKNGMAQIENASELLSKSDKFVLSNMIGHASYLRDQEMSVEDQVSVSVENNKYAERLMTIPGINVYSAVAIISEMDNTSRFSTKEKLAAYAGLVPRQDQSGNRDIRGNISKHGEKIRE